MTAAYLMVQTQIDDEEAFQPYKEQAPKLIKKYGGEYLVRGGKFEKLEGAEPLPRVVLIRFPDYDSALAWYNCEEYQELIKIRNACGKANILVAEALPEGIVF